MPFSVATQATDEAGSLDQLFEELQIDPDFRQIYAEFVTSTDNLQTRVLNQFSNLYLFSTSNATTWKIKINLKSFEIMHGMSRVTMLIPDKMATAIAINKENFPDPDDGGFLIQLVIDLVVFYISALRPIPILNVVNTFSRIEDLTSSDDKHLFSSPEVTVQLSDILIEFKDKLERLKLVLQERTEEAIISQCNLIVQMADYILELSNAYIDFVHPIYLDIERHGTFNDEKIDGLRKKVNEKLAEQKNRLKNEFVALTRPPSTDEE